jgi:hypothetical protein
MRGARWKVFTAVTLIVGVLAGCGGGEADKPAPAAGKVVQGETETGMKLKVETFVAPASDPLLEKLDRYRASAGYPAADYHRVTANNVAGTVPDRIRVVTFASNETDVQLGKGVDGRFGCDVLGLEWVPAGKASPKTFEELRSKLCAVEPNDPEGVKPGKRIVYYLVTDRTFAERGLNTKRIFGPRDAEFMAIS